MENFYYAQLDSEGYCSGLSQLSGEVIAENLIRIEVYDLNLLGLKYDLENNIWTEERRPEPEKSAVSHDDEVRASFLQELIEKGVVLSAMFLWGGAYLAQFLNLL